MRSIYYIIFISCLFISCNSSKKTEGTNQNGIHEVVVQEVLHVSEYSYIRVLENAGLVTRGRDAQFRPCTLNAKPLQVVADWTDQYRYIWDARFDVMDKILLTMKEENDE